MQKAGLHALTHNLAIELAGHKIRVNAVAPAAVKTPALERWVAKDEIDATLDTFAPLHPLGRVGTPADVANAVTYLLSDEASWVPARFSTSTAASWPAATNSMEVLALNGTKAEKERLQVTNDILRPGGPPAKSVGRTEGKYVFIGTVGVRHIVD